MGFALRFAIALLGAMGHSGEETERIAQALTDACGEDMACMIDGAVYADGESGVRETPVPYSWDAKAGRSCGPWQTPCSVHGLEAQARVWARLRFESLKACGDLTGLASGVCGLGRKLVSWRAKESAEWAAAMQWSEW